MTTIEHIITQLQHHQIQTGQPPIRADRQLLYIKGIHIGAIEQQNQNIIFNGQVIYYAPHATQIFPHTITIPLADPQLIPKLLKAIQQIHKQYYEHTTKIRQMLTP